MGKWLLIGGAGAVVGYVAVYFALDVKPAPEPPADPPTVATAPAEPVVLSDVVEVTNLEPLLNPRLEPLTGVPFDAAEPSEFHAPADAAEPIPPAGD